MSLLRLSLLLELLSKLLDDVGTYWEFLGLNHTPSIIFIIMYFELNVLCIDFHITCLLSWASYLT